MERTHTLDEANPYLLLTPGPLSTSPKVRAAMRRDYCTWDGEYKALVQSIRGELTTLASDRPHYTTVPMQGSGTFSVEATLGTVVPENGKLLVIDNGAYGARIAEIARRLRIDLRHIRQPETEIADVRQIEQALRTDAAITHVAVVHCETTTGILNPIAEIGTICARYEKTYIVDAMSSFGGIPLDMDAVGAHFLVSSANKCIQGVPGFGFVIAAVDVLAQCAGQARSLSLDLYDQWRAMEDDPGKWRYTSPTHVVRAFQAALEELADEGGVAQRYRRYRKNQHLLAEGMERLGFVPLLPREVQSPIITAFHYPQDRAFQFVPFYEALKRRGFVIYPGKVSTAETFRIGTIGHVFPDDIERLLTATAEAIEECTFHTGEAADSLASQPE